MHSAAGSTTGWVDISTLRTGTGGKVHTGVARGGVAELVRGVVRGANAEGAARGVPLPGGEAQLELRRAGVIGVAGPGGLEEGAGIAAICHEDLFGEVDSGGLGKVSTGSGCVRGIWTHRAANDSADAAREAVDDTIDEGEVESLCSDGADMEVAINVGADKFHKLVVDVGPGGILDLETEGGRDGARGSGAGDDALGRHQGGASEEGGCHDVASHCQ